jgi:peptidyl-prolyl cis-trans isomerase D
MRRHAKSWLIKFMIGMIAVVFIFYFGYPLISRQGAKIAYVNGEPISGLEYDKVYRNLLEGLQRDYKSAWSENLIQVFDLKNRALQNLIDQKLVSQEARRIGLDVTEEEIQNEIINYPAFQFRGRFDENRYRAVLDNNRMKPEDFEAGIAQELLQRKLRQFLMTFLPVTDQEVLDYYSFSNQKIKISFVQFLSENFKDSVKLDDTAMEKYFNERKEQYRVPEKIKIAYVVMDPDTFRGEAKITDLEIEGYYEENLERYKQEGQVRARHILFEIDQDAPEEKEKEVRERALSVLKKAHEGEDFASLASKYSEGPTREKGGDLGYFSRGQMVKPFEDAVFNMKKGEISDPVRTPFGYHIIKVEDLQEAKTKTQEEVREQIEKDLIKMASMDLAHEKALSLIDQMPYEVDLSEYAERHKVPVKQSGYFSSNDIIPDMGGDDKLRQLIFSLQKKDVSELIENKGKFYIIQVVDKKPSYLPDLEEVKEKLKEDFTSHLATLEAKSVAEKYLAKIKEGKNWDALAKESKLTLQTSDFFTRNDFIPQIGYAPDLMEEAFGLDKDKRFPDKVFENAQGVFVIRWEDQKETDEKKYQEEKDKYRFSLIQAKLQALFGDWLENLKKKAEIKVVQPVS